MTTPTERIFGKFGTWELGKSVQKVQIWNNLGKKKKSWTLHEDLSMFYGAGDIKSSYRFSLPVKLNQNVKIPERVQTLRKRDAVLG